MYANDSYQKISIILRGKSGFDLHLVVDLDLHSVENKTITHKNTTSEVTSKYLVILLHFYRFRNENKLKIGTCY